MCKWWRRQQPCWRSTAAVDMATAPGNRVGGGAQHKGPIQPFVLYSRIGMRHRWRPLREAALELIDSIDVESLLFRQVMSAHYHLGFNDILRARPDLVLKNLVVAGGCWLAARPGGCPPVRSRTVWIALCT